MYIVTPCFNAAATITGTIASVIGQQGIGFLRYHVQDGASTDGTQKILEHFAALIAAEPENYSHVTFTWASEKDAGMYDAINKGVSALDIPADALMGWLNADDIVCEGALENVHAAAKSLKDVDWFGGVPLITDMQGRVLGRGRADFSYPRQLIAQGACDGLHWRNLQQEGTFWRKRLWDAAGGLDPQYRLAGDWDLWRRMAKHADYVQLPEPIAAFRKRAGQLSEGSAYNEEVERMLPLQKRRKALRCFLPKLFFVKTRSAQRSEQGWFVRSQRISLSLKDVLGILFSSCGLYGLLRWCYRVNDKIRKNLSA
ncbi:MAG: hypothetical protein DELT_01084 [Desulfovibrio sp.]